MRIANRLMLRASGVAGFSNKWAATSAMLAAAARHAQVTLADGRVMVIAGRNSANVTDSLCYIGTVADDDSITWVQTTSLLNSRSSPAAVALADGRVLVVGGMNPSGTRQNKCYFGTVNGDATTWVESPNTYPVSLDEANLAQLPDGRVICFGGNTVFTQVRFGTITGNNIAWATGTSLPTGRKLAGVVITEQGLVMISGGCTDTTDKLITIVGTVVGNTVTWRSNGPPIPIDFFFRAYAATPDKTLVLAEVELGSRSGGRGYFKIDQDIPVFSWRNAASALPDGRCVMTGGYSSTNENTPVNNAYIGKFKAPPNPTVKDPSLVFKHAEGKSANGTVYTWPAIPLGDATDRSVIVFAHAGAVQVASLNVTGVTVGGVALQKVQQVSHNPSNPSAFSQLCSAWSGVVPALENADVVVTYSNTVVNGGVIVYSLYGEKYIALSSSASAVNQTTLDLSIPGVLKNDSMLESNILSGNFNNVWWGIGEDTQTSIVGSDIISSASSVSNFDDAITSTALSAKTTAVCGVSLAIRSGTPP